MTPEQRLKKKQLEFDRERFYIESFRDIAKNPIVEFAAGFALISYLSKGKQSWLERMTGADIMQGAMGAGLVGVITAQQLSAALPYIVQASDKLAPALIGGLLK